DDRVSAARHFRVFGLGIERELAAVRVEPSRAARPDSGGASRGIAGPYAEAGPAFGDDSEVVRQVAAGGPALAAGQTAASRTKIVRPTPSCGRGDRPFCRTRAGGAARRGRPDGGVADDGGGRAAWYEPGRRGAGLD